MIYIWNQLILKEGKESVEKKNHKREKKRKDVQSLKQSTSSLAATTRLDKEQANGLISIAIRILNLQC